MKLLNARLAAALALVAVAIIPVMASGADGARAQAEEYVVRAGDGEVGYSVNEFLPGDVFIEPGDTVKWTFPWFEPHSVTIGQGDPVNPSHPGQSTVEFNGDEFVNSALIFGNPQTPPSFSIKFNKAGTYNYYCYIHPGMTGTVKVLGPGQGLQDEQVAIDSRGASEYQSAIGGLKAVAAGLNAKPVAVTPRQGGGKKYTLAVAGETPNGDVQQFFPAVANVGLNDSIEWVSDVHTPHTVTFGQPPADVIANAGGDIFAVPPIKPAATFDGTGFWHSGIIGLDFPSGQKFEISFSKAGSYTYVCVLHADQGMVGTVNVASQTAPGAPNTGTGLEAGATGSGRDGLWLIGGVVALATLLTGTTVFAARR